MADIMRQPQGPDDRGLPVHPVVAGSANQTNARVGGMVPGFEAAAAADPGWGARLALAQKLNPPVQPPPGPNPTALFSQALPANGGPTPTFAPSPADHAKVALGYVLSGETPQAQPGTPAAASAAQPAAAQLNQDPSQQHLHAMNNPHLYTDDDFVKMFAGKPIGYVKQLFSMLQPPSMQDQAMRGSLAEAYKTGGESEAAKLLQWYGLGPNALMYGGMQKPPGQ